jgi:hypothetical protein
MLANDAADGTMPLPSPSHIGRAAIDRSEPKRIILYLIPLDSTIMSASALAGSIG